MTTKSHGLRVMDKMAVDLRRKKMQTFLEHHMQGGNVRLSCEAAGIGRSTFNWWVEQSALNEENPNPNFCLEAEGQLLPFHLAVQEARENFMDIIEEEARRRAVDGTDEPVFGSMGSGAGSGQIGYKRVYSDNLLMFFMKGMRPNKWRENVKVEHEHTGTVNVESARDRLAQKLLDAIANRRDAETLEGVILNKAPQALPEAAGEPLDAQVVRRDAEPIPVDKSSPEAAQVLRDPPARACDRPLVVQPGRKGESESPQND